jgi:hypothetical protein
MQEMIYEAGWTAYPLLLTAMAAIGTGLVAVVLAAAKALRPALVVAGIAAGFAFVGVAGGRLGYHDGLRGSYKAVAHAAPSDRQTIIVASEREARSAITLGLFSLPGGLLGALAVGLSFARTGSKR